MADREQTSWVENGYAYAITLDDQWLTHREVIRMMDDMRAVALPKGVVWQTLKIEWDEPSQHYVMSAQHY